MSNETDALAEVAKYVGIRRLQAAYADAVNRREWSDFSRLFLDDAPITIDRQTDEPLNFTGPTEIGNFIGASIEQFSFFEFVVLTSHLDIEGSATHEPIAGRLYMCELRQHAETGMWTTAFGLYQDSYIERDGRWLFAARRYQSLARTAAALEIFPLPTMSF